MSTRSSRVLPVVGVSDIAISAVLILGLALLSTSPAEGNDYRFLVLSLPDVLLPWFLEERFVVGEAVLVIALIALLRESESGLRSVNPSWPSAPDIHS